MKDISGKSAIKTGRNAPCPCGSGKKFKKCCGSSQGIPGMPEKIDMYQEEDEFIDCEIPIETSDTALEESFFTQFDPEIFSTYRMMYTRLLNPELEGYAEKAVKKITPRWKEQAKIIEKAATVDELISVMETGLDTLNFRLVIKKMKKDREESAWKLLALLHEPQPDKFFELSMRILYASEIDVSDGIIEILLEHRLSARHLATMCVLLGFYRSNKSAGNILYSFLMYFREKFPLKNYWEGPYYGLYEYFIENEA